MSKQVLLNVSLEIQVEKLDVFQAIVREMVEAARKEPGTLGYEWYVSSDGKRCRVIETYADANALLAHLAGSAVREGVPKVLATASVSGFEVYGDPGANAKEALGKFGAEIFSYWHGLER